VAEAVVALGAAGQLKAVSRAVAESRVASVSVSHQQVAGVVPQRLKL
jgi:hypothetical protein